MICKLLALHSVLQILCVPNTCATCTSGGISSRTGSAIEEQALHEWAYVTYVVYSREIDCDKARHLLCAPNVPNIVNAVSTDGSPVRRAKSRSPQADIMLSMASNL